MLNIYIENTENIEKIENMENIGYFRYFPHFREYPDIFQPCIDDNHYSQRYL